MSNRMNHNRPLMDYDDMRLRQDPYYNKKEEETKLPQRRKSFKDFIQQNINNASEAQKLLWLELYQVGGFTFKHIINTPQKCYIVQFYHAGSKTVIEITRNNKKTHAQLILYDIRTQRIEKRGYRFITYPEAKVKKNLNKVFEDILNKCEENMV